MMKKKITVTHLASFVDNNQIIVNKTMHPFFYLLGRKKDIKILDYYFKHFQN